MRVRILEESTHDGEFLFGHPLGTQFSIFEFFRLLFGFIEEVNSPRRLGGNQLAASHYQKKKRNKKVGLPNHARAG